jgi:uncharacterized protein (TIGR02246 family)
MKIRLVVALVGLAIGFAVPAFAQQKETVDPQIAQQIRALRIKYDEAFNKNDAAALAALYTEDAVEVTDEGPIYGREAIEKHFADVFKQVHVSNHLGKVDQYSPHIIGPGNEIWANGEWSLTFQGKSGGPIQAKGYWSAIDTREGDTWKIRIHTWNTTPSTSCDAVSDGQP